MDPATGVGTYQWCADCCEFFQVSSAESACHADHLLPFDEEFVGDPNDPDAVLAWGHALKARLEAASRELYCCPQKLRAIARMFFNEGRNLSRLLMIASLTPDLPPPLARMALTTLVGHDFGPPGGLVTSKPAAPHAPPSAAVAPLERWTAAVAVG